MQVVLHRSGEPPSVRRLLTQDGNKRVDNQGRTNMDLYLRRAPLALLFAATLIVACTPDDDPQLRSDDVITIPNLTGFNRAALSGSSTIWTSPSESKGSVFQKSTGRHHHPGS